MIVDGETPGCPTFRQLTGLCEEVPMHNKEYVQVKFRCYDMLAYMHNILVVWYLHIFTGQRVRGVLLPDAWKKKLHAAVDLFVLALPLENSSGYDVSTFAWPSLRTEHGHVMSRRLLVVVSKLGDTDTAHPRAMMLCFVLWFRLTMTFRRSPSSRGLKTFCYPQVQRIVIIIFHCFTLKCWYNMI